MVLWIQVPSQEAFWAMTCKVKYPLRKYLDLHRADVIIEFYIVLSIVTIVNQSKYSKNHMLLCHYSNFVTPRFPVNDLTEGVHGHTNAAFAVDRYRQRGGHRGRRFPLKANSTFMGQ